MVSLTGLKYLKLMECRLPKSKPGRVKYRRYEFADVSNNAFFRGVFHPQGERGQNPGQQDKTKEYCTIGTKKCWDTRLLQVQRMRLWEDFYAKLESFGQKGEYLLGLIENRRSGLSKNR